MRIPDPNDEIRAIRDRLSAACDYDVDKIVDETRRHQAESGCTYVNLGLAKTGPTNASDQTMHSTRLGSRDES